MIELYAKLKFNKGYNRHPRTPWHNGKVERSHRNDNKRFYKYLSFYSYDDLINQMKKYLYRSNRLPIQTLGGANSCWEKARVTEKLVSL